MIPRPALTFSCLVAPLLVAAQANKRSVRVSSVLEGAAVPKTCEVQLVGMRSRDEFRPETITLKGKSVLQLPNAKESIWVFPANSATLALGKGVFLDGYGILRPDGKSLTLRLRALPISKSPILVVGQDQKPLARAEVHIKALVAHGDQKGPLAELQWRCTTDEKGIFQLSLFDGKNLRFEITPVKVGDDVLEGTTRVRRTAIKVGKAFQVSCKRQAQNLKVQLQWDPAFSKKAFETDGSLHYNIIELELGRVTKQGHIGKTGQVKFFGVRPGKHRIKMTKWSGQRFLITKGPRGNNFTF